MPGAGALGLLWRGRRLASIHRCQIHDTRVVTKLHEELAVLRMRYGQGVARETIRHLHGMGKGRIGGDRVDQEEIVARQLACQVRCRRTYELVELRQTYQ